MNKEICPVCESGRPHLCPICGSIPKFEKESLDRGNGHGYPGNYEYTYSCPLCKIPKQGCCCDVNATEEWAIKTSIKRWNENVEIILGHLESKAERIQKIIDQYKRLAD